MPSIAGVIMAHLEQKVVAKLLCTISFRLDFKYEDKTFEKW